MSTRSMRGRFVHGPTRLCRWNRTIERIRASSSHRTPTRWKYLIRRWAGNPRLTSICPYSPARARSSIADDTSVPTIEICQSSSSGKSSRISIARLYGSWPLEQPADQMKSVRDKRLRWIRSGSTWVRRLDAADLQPALDLGSQSRQRDDVVRDAGLHDEPGHTPDDARRLVLHDHASTRLVQLTRAAHPVIAHPGHHDAEGMGAERLGHAPEEAVYRRT